MGTRGLTAVYKDGDFRIAQYGQWDHYLSGQGQTVLDFFKDNTPEDLANALTKVRWITEEEYAAGVAEVGIDPEAVWVTMDEGRAIDRKFPYLTRDHGAGILQAVVDASGEVLLRDGRNFATDSLFCEYAYVIDLDERVLEIYKGFQTEPHSEGRFADWENEEDVSYRSGNQYAPVRLLVTFSLDSLPVVFESRDVPEDEDSDIYSESIAVFADGTEQVVEQHD